jgi:hypothetical protein
MNWGTAGWGLQGRAGAARTGSQPSAELKRKRAGSGSGRRCGPGTAVRGGLSAGRQQIRGRYACVDARSLVYQPSNLGLVKPDSNSNNSPCRPQAQWPRGRRKQQEKRGCCWQGPRQLVFILAGLGTVPAVAGGCRRVVEPVSQRLCIKTILWEKELMGQR